MKEFFTDPASGEVMYRVADGPIQKLTESDVEIIEEILTKSENFYPEQYKAVSDEYSKSSANKRYYNFLRTRRILNCCFGVNDSKHDIDHKGNYNFERVPCPLIAECKYYKIICQAQFNTKLTERETEVMKLVLDLVPTEQIAERLFLSIHTVNNHRRNALQRLGLHSIEEFISYAYKNKLFN